VQIIAFEHSVHLFAARDDPELRDWGPLRNLAGTHARIADANTRVGLELLLLSDNSAAKDRWEKWLNGAPYPRNLNPADPGRLHWEPTPRGKLPHDHETVLQGTIQEHLLRKGWRAHDPRSDGFALPKSKLLFRSDGRRGYPDIVLVSKSEPKRLLLIEVKKEALPQPGRSGIDQLDDYGRAMTRIARGWHIDRWLVAQTIHPAVSAQARERRFKCYQWHKKRPYLREI
jgi:hypothetical protein